jgi:hypothetical protein
MKLKAAVKVASFIVKNDSPTVPNTIHSNNNSMFTAVDITKMILPRLQLREATFKCKHKNSKNKNKMENLRIHF